MPAVTFAKIAKSTLSNGSDAMRAAGQSSENPAGVARQASNAQRVAQDVWLLETWFHGILASIIPDSARVRHAGEDQPGTDEGRHRHEVGMDEEAQRRPEHDE